MGFNKYLYLFGLFVGTTGNAVGTTFYWLYPFIPSLFPNPISADARAIWMSIAILHSSLFFLDALKFIAFGHKYLPIVIQFFALLGAMGLTAVYIVYATWVNLYFLIPAGFELISCGWMLATIISPVGATGNCCGQFASQHAKDEEEEQERFALKRIVYGQSKRAIEIVGDDVVQPRKSPKSSKNRALRE